jgi:hypothetical protein
MWKSSSNGAMYSLPLVAFLVCLGNLRADEWHQKYVAVAQKNQITQWAKRGDQQSFLRQHNYLPSVKERELLQELRDSEVHAQLKALEEILEASIGRDDLPIEFAIHAIAGGDEKLQLRIVQELIQPRYERAKFGDADAVPLFRAAIELKQANTVPGLTTDTIKFLIERRPDRSEDPNDRAVYARQFEYLLRSVAERSLVAEREGILEVLVKAVGTPFSMAKYQAQMRRHKVELSSIVTELCHELASPRSPNASAEAVMTRFLAENNQPRDLVKISTETWLDYGRVPEPRRKEVSNALAEGMLDAPINPSVQDNDELFRVIAADPTNVGLRRWTIQALQEVSIKRRQVAARY